MLRTPIHSHLKVAIVSFIICSITQAHAGVLGISVPDCHRLIRHIPVDDVRHGPGVDARGNAIAPADLGGDHGLDIPGDIHIEIGIDLADRGGLGSGIILNVPAVRKVLPYEGKGALGLITIRGGDIFWNGEALTPQGEIILADACRQRTEEVGTTLPTNIPLLPAGD